MMKKKRLLLLIISTATLFLGLSFYLLFNNQAFISKVLLEIVPIQTINSSNPIILLIRGFGADLLWATAFTMIIQFIMWVDKKKTIYLIQCALLGIAYEIMQCFGVVPGTADIVDVFVYILGSIFAIIIIQGGNLYEEESSISNRINS